LRAIWALHLTAGMTLEDIGRWAKDRDPWVRSWIVQLYYQNADLLYGVEELADLALTSTESLIGFASSDDSPVVRRYVASAVQRLPVKERWGIVTELLRRGEDAGDHNLPLMYWYAVEACVATDPVRGVALLKECRIPKVREFIARRLATESLAASK
jgi:hypothetical protein